MPPPHALLVSLFLAWTFTALPVAQRGDLDARSRTAARAMSDGRYDDAAAAYRELLAAIPNDPGLLANLGMALAMGGHEADAVGPLERALELDPGSLPARLFLGSSYLALGQPEKAIPLLKRVVAARPADVENRRMLAQAYAASGREIDAVSELRTITEVAPSMPSAWFALGHAYNAVAQEAIGTFDEQPGELAWRQLLLADALKSDGRLTDAFALYRSALEDLPAMVTIHDSIAGIYDQTGHADWAARERPLGALPAGRCATRKALCEFRAGRYRQSLDAALAGAGPESRYWAARAATELARAAFSRLDTLPDSRERREFHATMARAQRRYNEAIAELEAALKLAPGDPDLVEELGTTYYFAREYDRAVATLLPIVKRRGADAQLLTMCGDALLQLQRVDEALPLLERAVALDGADSAARLALARVYLQKEYFAAAVPLFEVELANDQDGSLHVQLARAYTGLGERDKAAALLVKSQEIQRAMQDRNAAASQRTITPPK